MVNEQTRVAKEAFLWKAEVITISEFPINWFSHVTLEFIHDNT